MDANGINGDANGWDPANDSGADSQTLVGDEDEGHHDNNNNNNNGYNSDAPTVVAHDSGGYNIDAAASTSTVTATFDNNEGMALFD